MARESDNAAHARHPGCGRVSRDEGVECAASVHTLDNLRLEPGERPDVPHSVPWIQLARRLALGFVALEKPRHEELTSQRRQAHAPGFSITDDLFGAIGIDYLDHRLGRRRIVDDSEVVLRYARLVYGEAHECVAVRWSEVDAIQQLLHSEAMELRRHFRASAKHALDPDLLERYFLAQRFQQLRRGEQALDVFVRAQQCEPL